MSFVVAIDGPAGSGKGTITEKVGEKLELINIDTGAMYRCIALESINQGIEKEEVEKIIQIAQNIKIELQEHGKVFLNGKEVTNEIRSKEVTSIVSPISSIVEVRIQMVDLQRKMAEGKNIIMEGRDIGTVVFPQADVKIYLDARAEERATRRWKQNQEKGIDMLYEEILESIQIRDENDKNKEMGALKQAEDAIYLDTTTLTIEEVTEKIVEIIKEKRK